MDQNAKLALDTAPQACEMYLRRITMSGPASEITAYKELRRAFFEF